MPKIPKRTNEKNGRVILRGLAERIRAFGELRVLFKPVPKEWLKRSSRASKNGHTTGGDSLTLKECDSYKTLVQAWGKAVKWTDGLDHGLASMLASIASTKAVGDQLWLKVIGPASCGKSILCEALSTSTKHVVAKSTIRGFNTGYSIVGSEDKDNSLLAELFDKTLIVKDGDTILQSPTLPQFLSEARDIYDGANRPSYRNQMSKNYVGIRMTVILCGTSSLRKLDSSELGERFLDCVIMDGIDSELEDEIGWRVINRTISNLGLESDANPETQQSPEMTEAMALTGGYVDYLRENASEKLSMIDFPEDSRRRCMRLGRFVAFMRARPSYLQEENAEREFSPRLISQLGRLANCLAFVLNRKEVDRSVMKKVKRIAMDTGRGTTMIIAKSIYEEGPLQVGTIATRLSKNETQTKRLLQFMRQIGITETIMTKTKGVRTKMKWKLTEQFYDLYEEVLQ